MLYIGAVVSCDESQVTVKFSGWTGVQHGSEEDTEEVEESHALGDIIGQWRIITA
jgi:hypothetical protein